MGAREFEFVADEIAQQQARLDLALIAHAIDADYNAAEISVHGAPAWLRF
jgi:hypothetical protein